MKSYELKLKTESGRNVTIAIGSHENMQEAISKAYSQKDVSNAQKFTVQVCDTKASTRKKLSTQN